MCLNTSGEEALYVCLAVVEGVHLLPLEIDVLCVLEIDSASCSAKNDKLYISAASYQRGEIWICTPAMLKSAC